MKKILYAIIFALIIMISISACCGGPKTTISTVSNVGRVKITAEPDSADVYIDGVLSGKARDFNGRKQVLELPAGRHKIEIKAEGYFPYSREIMVGAGALEDFKVMLSKQ